MHETSKDLIELQRLLDESYASAGEHLRSIFLPDQLCSATELVAALPGIFLIHLATVTARCEPLVAPLDGLFYRGRLWFGLPPGAQRARHLRARPQVSATHIDGEFCLIVHGTAREVTDGHPLYAGFSEYARALYGPDLIAQNQERYRGRREPEFNGFIEARRMYAQGIPARVS